MYWTNRTLLPLLAVAVLVAPDAGRAAEPPGGPGPDRAAALAPAWTATPAQGTIGSSPVYARGSVYYTEDAYPRSDPRTGVRISRRDARTGRVLPFAAGPVDALLAAQPATDGSRIFTVSAYEKAGGGAHLRAYGLDGRVLWARPVTGEQFLLSLVVAGPLVITASESGCGRGEEVPCARTTVSAWLTATGRRVWDRTVEGFGPRLAAAAGRLAITTATPRGPGDRPPPDGDTMTLTAVGLADGRPLWVREKLASGPLAVDADNVYVAAGSLCAVRTADGHGRWCAGKGQYQDVTAAAGGIVARVDGGLPHPRVTALDTTGRVRWSSPASPTGPLTVAGGVVWLQHYDFLSPPLPHPVDRPTRLVGLRATDGARLTTLPVSDGYSSGSVTVGDGRVFTTAYLTAVLGFAPARR